MNKDVTICFRTSADLRASLKKVAKRKKRTLSSLIENVVYDYLEQISAVQGLKGERRRFPRKETTIPAMISEVGRDEKLFFTGTILDLSLNGVRISVPKESKYNIVENGDNYFLEILFALPNNPQPMSFKCKPCRFFDTGQDVQMGAFFSDADFKSYQGLQEYLV